MFHARGVVRQVGARNYAGPNCPGAGWNCTSSTRVLQVATDGGQNVAQCTDASPVITANSQACTISQSGTNNTATCTLRATTVPLAAQTCTITQTGYSNTATVAERIQQADGSDQAGEQTATVTQTAAGGSNDLHIKQEVMQQSKTGSAQTQEGHQRVDVIQTATGAGTNAVDTSQSQDQKAWGASFQSQDAAVNNAFDCSFNFPSAPNACANISQTADAGTNSNKLAQSVSEDAKTEGFATQQQGTFAGGLEGAVHQETATGRSTNQARQDKHQFERNQSGFQSQHDPVSCCGFASQLGGSGNTEDINQSSDLNASNPLAFQQSALLGTSHSPTGGCSISQHAKINIDSTTNSDSLNPCPFLTLATECTGGGGDAPTTQQDVTGCVAFPPSTEPPPECLDCILVGPQLFASRP